MIGLGVGIDYALLMITRHRAALASGKDVAAAVREGRRAASEEGSPAGSSTRSAVQRRPPVSRASFEDAPVATVIRRLERCHPD